MPAFEYTARTVRGELRSATMEAPTKAAVVQRLRRMRLRVVTIAEPGTVRRTHQGSITMREMVVFTRQFSTMIHAGLPLVQALDILSTQSANPALQSIARQVVFDVESGETVADALATHPRAFSELYVHMVAAGEAGGILDTILLRLATFLEQNDALIRKVRGAMLYPGLIVGVAFTAIAVLLLFVIPTFQVMFASAGMELPLPTRLVIGLSASLQAAWWAVALAGVVGFYGLRQYAATAAGRRTVDRLLLRVPVLGHVIRKAAVSRFTRTLGTLIGSGVSILDGLEITAKTAGNRVIADAIIAARASIAGGDTIAAPLRRSGVFPPMVISMIAVGEQTGGLDAMLGKIADFYDEEVDAAVSGLLALLEPAMIACLGVVVGGMVVAMYLPIFDMINAVQ